MRNPVSFAVKDWIDAGNAGAERCAAKLLVTERGSVTSATRSTSARNEAAEPCNHLRAGQPATTRRVTRRRIVRPNHSRDLHPAFAPSENTNGIPSQCPGLRWWPV